MVREIKDSKKSPIKIQDPFESKREKDRNERFIYNNLENYNDKGQIPKKGKNEYSSNINYLREQLNYNYMNQKKNNKKRGKSGYKFDKDKYNVKYINKNKFKINSNTNFFKNNILNNINNINNTGDNVGEAFSLYEDKKLKYNNGNNYKIYNNNNSAEYNNNSNYYINNINLSKKSSNSTYHNMALNDLEFYMNDLWNKLGVKEIFQKTFNQLKEEMENDDEKKELMIMEVENSEKLEKILNKLCLDIEKREKSVLLLKRVIEVIEKQFIGLNIDIKENILNDLYKAIIGYRINTINVVENIILYNQFFTYPINKGKYNEDFLIKKYKIFDNENNYSNYLLKIKNDLNFLGDSKINGYRQLKLYFSSNSDPFLLSMTEHVPINIDYFLRIKQCQYVIMQEVIFDSINSGKENKNNNNNTLISDNKRKKLEPINNSCKILSNSNSNITNNSKIIKKENIPCLDKKQIKKKNVNINNKKDDNEKHLIDKKDYQNFFGPKANYEDQTEEQSLKDLKKELKLVKSLKKHKKQLSKIKIDSNNSKLQENNNNKRDNNKENIENNKSKEIKDNNKDIIINQKEKNIINNEIEQNMDNNENKDNLNKEEKEIKNEEIKKEENKEIKNDKKIEEEIFNSNISNISKEKKDEHKEIEDKDNNENFINLKENININEETNKIKNNNNILNKDNISDDDILDISYNSKNTKNSKEKSRSVTPKSNRVSKNISLNEINQMDIQNKDNNLKNGINIHTNKDNDYISFYCGKISNFIPIYSTYYNTIPEEQKIIFNLKSELVQYLYNNFFPKIILYSDKKTKTIKGLCIISHIFTNEAKNNGLFIEHISSYSEEEREIIFEKLLSFIKENSYNIFGFENNKKNKEIYIDLYYKSEDGKFSINTEIRDFFRNQLKFKWVKLENLSKFIRFQKMRHQFMINNGINNNMDLLNNEYDDNNILNQSILGRKEFNNDENNNQNDEEEESEDDEINIDISRIFDNDKQNNENDKDNINIKNTNDPHTHISFNLLNNFLIKNKTVLKFNNKNYINKNKNNFAYIKYSNPFNFIYLLNKINENVDISYDNISPNINYYFNQKDYKIINNILSKCIKGNKNILSENNLYYSDVHELMKEKKNKFKINTNISIQPIFDNCISFKYNNYYYNRVQIKKIQTFKDKETQQIFYLINKSENLILLISSTLNENFKQKYINKENRDNISINFMNMYNNLLDIDNIDKNILYIPAFEIKSKLVNNCFTNINSENKSNLYCFEDYYNVKYLTEELMTSKNNKNKKSKNYNGNIGMNFDYDLIKEIDVNKENFIQENFLLVILNLNIIEDLRALPLLTLYVTKDNFISI